MYIQDFFIKFYDYRPFKSRLANKIIGNTSKIGLMLANIILPIWFKLFPGEKYYIQKINTNQQKNVIICLTTFPSRINKLWLVIECILRQTTIPHKIVLYLSKEQFPDSQSLPITLIKYTKKCLDIKFVEEDIKSHKKYWYAIKDFPNIPIITIDDDIIYTSKTIEILTKGAEKHPNSVLALYCHLIQRNHNGTLKSYSDWIGNTPINKSEKDIFFGSGGGTYFPCGSLKEANQPFDTIMSICPFADDIWLNAFIRKNGYNVCCLKKMISVPEWYISNNKKLNSINNGENQNDIQLSKIIKFMKEKYQINPFD